MGRVHVDDDTCWPAFGGAANIDEITVSDRGFAGLTVRLLDPVARTWSLWWVNSRDGQIEPPPVTGCFTDGVGLFYCDQLWEGRPIRCRFTWSEITPTSARWDQAFSVDDGQTWENQLDHLVLAGDQGPRTAADPPGHSNSGKRPGELRRVEPCVGAVPRRAVRRGCLARRSDRAPSRGFTSASRIVDSRWRVSRNSSCPRAASSSPAGSAPRSWCRQSSSPHPGSGWRAWRGTPVRW